jgi:hypothetical protein
MARNRTANISGELITNTIIATSTGANVSNALVKTGDTMTGNLTVDGANLNVNGKTILYGNDPDLIQNMYSNSNIAEVISHEFRVDNIIEAQLSYHKNTNETTLYGANANSILQLGAGGKANVIYITNTANVIISDQNNRVVIGSTTPGGDAPFSVVSDDFTGLGGEVFLGEFCPANTDGSVAIGYFANGVSDLYGFIRSRHGVDLGLGAGAGNNLYIKQGGNVGIGTTSPNQKLHVEGSIFTPSSIFFATGSNTRLSGSGSGELGLNFNTVGTSDFHLRVYDVAAPALNNAIFQVARTTGNTKIGFDGTNPNSVAANLHVQTNSDRALHVDGPVSGPVYLTAVNNNIGPYDLRELGLRGDPVTIYTGSGAKSNAVARISFPSDAAGITFPATQAASSNANTLDDYEEGTWDVKFENSSGSESITFTGAGTYTKIGRLVHCQINIYNASFSAISAGNHIFLRGLPFAANYFAASNAFGSYPAVPVSIVDGSGTQAPCFIPSNSVDYTFWTRNSWGGATNITVRGQFTYQSS